MGKQWGIHKILYMPNLPKALLGRDLLEQLQATIKLKNEEVTLEVNDQRYIEVLSLTLKAIEIEEEIDEEILSQIFCKVWASDVPGRAKKCLPHSN